MNNAIVIAGATGNLGGRIVKVLIEKGATVHAIVRASSDPAKIEELTRQGVTIIHSDITDAEELAPALKGAAVVVSVLQGLHDVIVGTQSVLLQAAVAAGVPRFIPSDFSTDFSQLVPGENRNFDLRREFRVHLDKAPIQATSILNGAFAEILSHDTPLLNYTASQVGYWDDADWHIDFTTMDNTAAFTAAAALDADSPRFLRIASFQISPRELVTIEESVGKGHFALVELGSRAELTAQIKQLRAANPAGEENLYSDWQLMQYMLSMFGAQNNPLDNDRYPGMNWTPATEALAA